MNVDDLVRLRAELRERSMSPEAGRLARSLEPIDAELLDELTTVIDGAEKAAIERLAYLNAARVLRDHATSWPIDHPETDHAAQLLSTRVEAIATELEQRATILDLGDSR